MKPYGWRNALMNIWRSEIMPIAFFIFALGFLLIAFGYMLAVAFLRILPCGMCEGGPL